MFYSGVALLCAIFCPPIITIVAIGFIFSLKDRMNLINISKKQLLIIGVVIFIISFIAVCFLVNIPTMNGYRAF